MVGTHAPHSRIRDKLMIPHNAECPACRTQLTRYSSWIERCPACRFMRSSLEPGSGTDASGFEALRRANFERLLDRLEPLGPLSSKRLLEVGCARGWFLEAARSRGMHVCGIEPQDSNRAAARALGFDVAAGFFPEAAGGRGPFDVIVFNDVFEHLPDPVVGIRAVADLLAGGGIAVINLPSSDGLFFRLARTLDRLGISTPWERMWQKGLPSPHLSYFNASNIVKLANAHTALRLRDEMRLETLERRGLRSRVKGATPGLTGVLVFGTAWVLSFATRWLPADIVAVFLEKPASADPTHAVTR
ncbi:MAG: methyltransferase domain-containing protein [Hyphomicrobium sp.]